MTLQLISVLYVDSSRPAPVTARFTFEGDPYVGLGRCTNAVLQRLTDPSTDNVCSLVGRILIDLRTVRFENASALRIEDWLLKIYDDPLLRIQLTQNSGDKSADTPVAVSATVTWQGKTHAYPLENFAAHLLRRDTFGDMWPPEDVVSVSFALHLDLRQHGIALAALLAQSFPDPIITLQADIPLVAVPPHTLTADFRKLQQVCDEIFVETNYHPQDTETLLAALVRSDTVAARALEQAGSDLAALRHLTESKLQKGEELGDRRWTDRNTFDVLNILPIPIAARHGERAVTSLHVLAAIGEVSGAPEHSRIGEVLNRAGLSPTRLIEIALAAAPARPVPLAREQIRVLGTPSLNRYSADEQIYARNIWDMQVWQGRLYLGHGNSSNHGPASNAGPVDVWYYDPVKATFVNEFTIDDEQIDRFVLDRAGMLIPGHDPEESWDWGNLYVRRRHSPWRKLRTLPNGIHCYDVLRFKNNLFAALCTEKRAQVARSTDDGETWNLYPLEGADRAYTLFTVGGTLFVSADFGYTYRFEDGAFVPEKVNLFPEYKGASGATARIVRPITFQGDTVYIGVHGTNDHQWEPFGLFAARRRKDRVEFTALSLPTEHGARDIGAVPYDILMRDTVCYVLSCRPPSFAWVEALSNDARAYTVPPADDDYTIYVHASRNLVDWEEICRFPAPTFARSFEYLNGDWFFGLGCNVVNLAAETGQVWCLSR